MKPALKRIKYKIWHVVDEAVVEGAPKSIMGDLTCISGDLTGIMGDLTCIMGDLTFIRGNLTGIMGDLTFIRGNLTGIMGNLTGIRGDIDDCEITDEEREEGITVEQLIMIEEVAP